MMIKNLLRAFIVGVWKIKGRPAPPPGQVKLAVLNAYRKKYNCDLFVETGTFKGDMIAALKGRFKKLYSIELSRLLWERASERFKNVERIILKEGDSGKVLQEVVPELNSRTLFWLDAHYSAGPTAKGEKESPIMEELLIIFNYNKYGHIILIDDARLFTGEDDYPTIDALETFVKKQNPAYQVEVKDDIIRLTTE